MPQNNSFRKISSMVATDKLLSVRDERTTLDLHAFLSVKMVSSNIMLFRVSK